MAAISINIQGLDKTLSSFDSTLKNIEADLINEMNEWGNHAARRAKELAPTDEGHLKGAINANYAKKGNLQCSVTVAVNYAAYIEFGTKKYAASYVSTLPADWKTFAASFKGKGGGDYFEFLNAILDWVLRKGIASRFSVKTQKKIKINLDKPAKSGVGKSDYDRLHDAAYAIALTIVRKGIKPHPYLYPATQEANKEFLKNTKTLIK